MKTNSGTVLLYNCSGGKYSKLQQIFAMLRLRMRQVGPEKYDLPLELLARGEGEDAAEPGTPFAEPMLVFCGVNDALLDQVLQVLRVSDIPRIGLKAVLTPDNRTWDSRRLYEELSREREAIQSQQRSGS